VINPNDLRTLESQRKDQFEVLGWSMSKKITVRNRIDEVASIFAMVSTIGSGPTGPSDIRMNCFRFYDVLRLISGDNFDWESNFELTDTTDGLTAWTRFKYFSFVAEQLKPYILGPKYEDVLMSLYNMQLYQLIPCLVAAFRVKESDEEWYNIGLAYPIIELKNWTSRAQDDLMSVKVRETLEWVKFIPLVASQEEFLDSKLSEAVIPAPFEEVEPGEDEVLRVMKYISIAPLWNFTVVDFYGKWTENWWGAIKNLVGVDDQKSYLISFNVTVKGYYLAEENFAPGDTLVEMYNELVKDWLFVTIKDSLIAQEPLNTLTSVADIHKAEASLLKVEAMLEDSISDVFIDVMDYTARQVLLTRSLKSDGSVLPLFYSFSAKEIKFNSAED